MSQLKDFGPGEQDPLNRLLQSVDELPSLFYQSEKPPDLFALGLEYEFFAEVKGRPLQYEGPVSIQSLFEALSELSHYEPILEEHRRVALATDSGMIALEPGGQLEIALKPFKTAREVTETFVRVLSDIKRIAQGQNINLFALGIHPTARRDEMASVKKMRYEIMRNYMKGLSGHGLDMMTRSCAIQLNLDYKNEQDMVAKMRLATSLVPFFSLLCSSSAFIEKKPASHALERGHIWRTTDRNRTGIPARIFDSDFGYRSWIDLALDVPMYFIRREHHYIDVSGASFRNFIKNGLQGYFPTLRDFIDHMSTVFTEVRLKPYLEFRSTDSLPVPYTNALIALTFALFYDKEGFLAAQKLFDGLDHQELITLHNDVIDTGKIALFRGRPVFELCEKLLTIGKTCLDKESAVLQPLSNLVERNITCAEWISKIFQVTMQIPGKILLPALSLLMTRWQMLNCIFVLLVAMGCSSIPEKPSDSDLAGRYYAIKSGDTIGGIAKIYKISRQELMEVNGITDERKLRVGQMLFLPDQDRIVEKLAPLKKGTVAPKPPELPPPATLSFMFPVTKGKVIYRFSKAKHNPYDGIGIAAPLKTPVLSAQSGKVLFAGDDKTKFGLVIIIVHEDPYITVYAHLASAQVKAGQAVQRGEIIGTVGTSGGVKIPHLHFQLRVSQRPKDPLGYLESRAK